jgi:hypothetical protein
LVPSSHRYVYIGILSLTPLKRLALSARVVAGEEREVEETAASQAALAPPAGTGSSGEDVVMVRG